MSIRSKTQDDSYASAVRRDLQGLKETALEAARLDKIDPTVKPEGTEAAAAYDSLNHVEQAAASLGAHPDALKPISFMNAAHYQNLIKQNALSDDLARRIEVRFSVTRPRNPNAILTAPPFCLRLTRWSRPRRSERARVRAGSARVNKSFYSTSSQNAAQ